MNTYLFGRNAIYFDVRLLDSLQDNLFWWRLSYRYSSSWRNLHVDGFEGYIWSQCKLPTPQNIHYQFFQYATSGVETQNI